MKKRADRFVVGWKGKGTILYGNCPTETIKPMTKKRTVDLVYSNIDFTKGALVYELVPVKEKKKLP